MKKGLIGTFTMNRVEPIHRWYAYIEGYSSALVEHELDLLKNEKITSVYDPFGGTGTTLLSSSMRGFDTFYSETNPFMNKVTSTKINNVIAVSENDKLYAELLGFRDRIVAWKPRNSKKPITWDGFEKYYEPEVLSVILKLKKDIEAEKEAVVREILMLALSSILVNSSKMIRRGDLRFARENEKKNVKPVKDLFIDKLNDVIEDISSSGAKVKKRVIALAEDVRDITEENLIDCVITSPPYLNGTNYIRNTKLELKFNDYVKKEIDLAQFHSKGIVAGINNVSKRTNNTTILPVIKPIYDELVPVAYDKRIPVMVASYFYDMNKVFEKLKHVMKDDSFFIMDIGDSQFAGVHVPTHTLLAELCESNGFTLYDDEVLRVRHSKNGMRLSQHILRFKLKK